MKYDTETEYEWHSGIPSPKRWVPARFLFEDFEGRRYFRVSHGDIGLHRGDHMGVLSRDEDGRGRVRPKRKIAQTFYVTDEGNITDVALGGSLKRARKRGFPIGYRLEGSRVIEWEDEEAAVTPNPAISYDAWAHLFGLASGEEWVLPENSGAFEELQEKGLIEQHEAWEWQPSAKGAALLARVAGDDA